MCMTPNRQIGMCEAHARQHAEYMLSVKEALEADPDNLMLQRRYARLEEAQRRTQSTRYLHSNRENEEKENFPHRQAIEPRLRQGFATTERNTAIPEAVRDAAKVIFVVSMFLISLGIVVASFVLPVVYAVLNGVALFGEGGDAQSLWHWTWLIVCVLLAYHAPRITTFIFSAIWVAVLE